MQNKPALCELCGEPMSELESVFKYHGYSGPCPKPPLKKTAKPTYEELENLVSSYRTALEFYADKSNCHFGPEHISEDLVLLSNDSGKTAKQALYPESIDKPEKVGPTREETIERALDKELIKEISERGVTVDGDGFGKVIAMKQAERIFAMMKALSAILEAARRSE